KRIKSPARQLAADPGCPRTDARSEDQDPPRSEPQRPYRVACEPERNAAEDGKDLIHRDLLGCATWVKLKCPQHSRSVPEVKDADGASSPPVRGGWIAPCVPGV